MLLLIARLPVSWPILIAVDETLERRKGKKIKAKGVYRDAVRSSQTHVVTLSLVDDKNWNSLHGPRGLRRGDSAVGVFHKVEYNGYR